MRFTISRTRICARTFFTAAASMPLTNKCWNACTIAFESPCHCGRFFIGGNLDLRIDGFGHGARAIRRFLQQRGLNSRGR